MTINMDLASRTGWVILTPNRIEEKNRIDCWRKCPNLLISIFFPPFNARIDLCLMTSTK